MTAARRGRHLPAGAYGTLVVAVFAGVIGLGAGTGAWQTSGRMLAGGEGGGNGAGQGAGQPMSAGEVKGWMTVGDVAEASGVPLADLLGAFGLPGDTPPATPIKDLESDTFSVPALRAWLAGQSVATP